jgi:hypothetical protein
MLCTSGPCKAATSAVSGRFHAGGHFPPPATTHAPGRSCANTLSNAAGDISTSCAAQNSAASAGAGRLNRSADSPSSSTSRQPFRSASARASAVMAGASSTPITCPLGPTFARIPARHSPLPHPTSTTVSPSFSGIARTISSRQYWNALVSCAYSEARRA